MAALSARFLRDGSSWPACAGRTPSEPNSTSPASRYRRAAASSRPTSSTAPASRNARSASSPFPAFSSARAFSYAARSTLAVVHHLRREPLDGLGLVGHLEPLLQRDQALPEVAHDARVEALRPGAVVGGGVQVAVDLEHLVLPDEVRDRVVLQEDLEDRDAPFAARVLDQVLRDDPAHQHAEGRPHSTPSWRAACRSPGRPSPPPGWRGRWSPGRASRRRSVRRAIRAGRCAARPRTTRRACPPGAA